MNRHRRRRIVSDAMGVLAGVAVLLVPVGLTTGVYVAESESPRLAALVRFAVDTINGVPSIVVGLFVYTVAVLPVHRYSAIAGGLALGVIMIPLIARTTEELLRLVPAPLREGALALGATRGQMVRTVVVPAALPGLITGAVLAFARAAGETAPLLFTAFVFNYWSTDVRQPISSVTMQMYTYAISPYDDLHRQAWAGAIVLVSIVLICAMLARVATRHLARMTAGQ